MQTRKFALQARIDIKVVEQWVAAGWLIPQQEGDNPDYSDVDLARAHLIRDLQDLGVNEEGIPIVLDLVDQLHGTRRLLRELFSALKAQQERGANGA